MFTVDESRSNEAIGYPLTFYTEKYNRDPLEKVVPTVGVSNIDQVDP